MSKAALIIISDFLLVSLLSLARFEPPAVQQREPEVTRNDKSQGAQDMFEVLQMALEDARESKSELSKQLESIRANLKTAKTDLQARASRIDQVEEHLQSAEERANALEREKARLEKQYADTRKSIEFLQGQYVETKKSAARIQSDLKETEKDAAVSRAKSEAFHDELSVRRQEVEKLADRMSKIESERRATEQEKFQLALELRQSKTEVVVMKEQLAASEDQLRTAESDVNYSREEVKRARTEVEAGQEEIQKARQEVAVVREEKQKLQEHAQTLAAGVTNLAAKSEAIRKEIHQNTPLAANAIFSDFMANRIQTKFYAARSGLFGRTVKREKKTNSILVSDGRRIYALYHVEDTPMTLWDREPDWEQLTGVVRRGRVAYAIDHISFLSLDPRVVIVPVGQDQAEKLGIKVYPIAEDPAQFQEAVLVGARKGYYGEAAFKLNPSDPRYVEMERKTFSRLTGQFSPSRGDLVFGHNGALLGIMVNNRYCAVLRRLTPSRRIRFGADVSSEKTGWIAAQLRARLDALPFRLQ